MAITRLTLNTIAGSLFSDSANAATVVAVSSASTIIYYIEADNTANAAVTYLKLWNVASGSVVVGTTAPDGIFMLRASTLEKFLMPGPTVYGTALSVASVTTGGTAGVTPPSTAITVKVAYT